MSDLEDQIKREMAKLDGKVDDLRDEFKARKRGFRASVAESPITSTLIAVAIGMVAGAILVSTVTV